MANCKRPCSRILVYNRYYETDTNKVVVQLENGDGTLEI